jgi:membrane protease subunit (stomatin/prohibitin family)
VADVIGEWMRERRLSVIDLATEYDELSESSHAALKPDFANLGLELTRFYINTITMPEELERRLDQAGGVAAMGGLDGYTRFKAAEALQDAAKSGGGGLAGAGVGLGVGVNLGAVMGNALAPSLQPGQTPAAPAAQTKQCPKCSAAVPAGAKFCNECGAALRPATCPKCGAAAAPGAKFCIECGTALNP